MVVTTDPIARNEQVVRAYLERHDVASLHPDAVFVDAASGMQWTGHEAIAGMLHWFYEVAFTAHLEDSRLIVGETAAVIEATFVGIHQAEFAGVPPTGREVRVPLVVVYDLDDGRITGARVHFSVASFLAQAAPAA
jgi:predicted ester cyclase